MDSHTKSYKSPYSGVPIQSPYICIIRAVRPLTQTVRLGCLCINKREFLACAVPEKKTNDTQNLKGKREDLLSHSLKLRNIIGNVTCLLTNFYLVKHFFP